MGDIKKSYSKIIFKVDRILYTRNNARKLIDIAKEYFEREHYFSSFIVSINAIEFSCIRILEAIIRDKAVTGEKAKSKYSKNIERRLKNYSLGDYTLGQLISFIEEEDNNFSEIRRLKKINRLRKKYIHLLSNINKISIKKIENTIKKEFKNKNIFPFIKELNSICRQIRSNTNNRIAPRF